MRILPLILIALCTQVIAYAVKPVDVTQRNRIFPQQRFDKKAFDLKKNESILNQRVQLNQWQGKQMSPLQGASAPITMQGTFDKELKTFPSFRRDESLISVQNRAYGIDDRQARLEKWDARWDKRKAPKYDKEPLLGAMMGLSDYFTMTEDLSMQDINRYQFRRSHSSEDGLKVTPVASGEE